MEIVQLLFHRIHAMSLPAPAFDSPEGAGLVSITTSDTVTCGAFPVGVLPSNPDAILIDQDAMRLIRLRKNVITSARYHVRECKGWKPVFVTLTYKPQIEWRANQISNYLKAVRNWYNRKGHACRYVWVYELTKAGRPHYHLIFWVPRGLTLPKADKRGWWPWGMTNTKPAKSPVGYLAKYASKGNDDPIPKGVRLYGVGGLSASSRLLRAWWNLPTYVRRWGSPSHKWRRAPGGGWVSRYTGEFRESIWSVSLVGGRVFAIPRPHTIDSPFDKLLLTLKSDWLRISP